MARSVVERWKGGARDGSEGFAVLPPKTTTASSAAPVQESGEGTEGPGHGTGMPAQRHLPRLPDLLTARGHFSLYVQEGGDYTKALKGLNAASSSRLRPMHAQQTTPTHWGTRVHNKLPLALR